MAKSSKKIDEKKALEVMREEIQFWQKMYAEIEKMIADLNRKSKGRNKAT